MGDDVEERLVRNDKDMSSYCSRVIPKGKVIEIGPEGMHEYKPPKKKL